MSGTCIPTHAMSRPLNETGFHGTGRVIIDNEHFTLSMSELHDEPSNSASPTDFDSASITATSGGYSCHTCEMSEARCGDHTIYYEVFGEGPRLLFFNGSGATIESTRLLLNVLAQHFTVAVHDQRGLGKSSCPQGPYTMADYATDGRAVLDAVGWSSCRVVGISFGGMVAQEFAVTWPHKVERLVLMCTSAGGPLGSSYPLHTLADLDADERASRSMQLMDSRFNAEWLAAHPSDRALVTDAARRAALPKSAEQVRGEREQLLARSFHDVSDRLSRIYSPTLVACGRFDGIAPPENSARIAETIPHAQLKTYEGGHMFMVQDHAAFPDMFAFLLSDAET